MLRQHTSVPAGDPYSGREVTSAKYVTSAEIQTTYIPPAAATTFDLPTCVPNLPGWQDRSEFSTGSNPTEGLPDLLNTWCTSSDPSAFEDVFTIPMATSFEPFTNDIIPASYNAVLAALDDQTTFISGDPQADESLELYYYRIVSHKSLNSG